MDIERSNHDLKLHCLHLIFKTKKNDASPVLHDYFNLPSIRSSNLEQKQIAILLHNFCNRFLFGRCCVIYIFRQGRGSRIYKKAK